MAKQYDKPKEESRMLKYAREEFSEFNNTLNAERDENKFINSLKEFIEKNRSGISTSQLRNIFSKLKKIDDKNYQDIYSVRPKLAYTYGRSDKDGMKKLLVSMDYFIQRIDTKEKLTMFKNFFEAVIAYHKFYGGK